MNGVSLCSAFTVGLSRQYSLANDNSVSDRPNHQCSLGKLETREGKILI